MCKQGVDQCSVRAAWSRVNGHARRFIDDDQVIVFENDGKRYVLGFWSRGLGWGKRDLIDLALDHGGRRVRQPFRHN